MIVASPGRGQAPVVSSRLPRDQREQGNIIEKNGKKKKFSCGRWRILCAVEGCTNQVQKKNRCLRHRIPEDEDARNDLAALKIDQTRPKVLLGSVESASETTSENFITLYFPSTICGEKSNCLYILNSFNEKVEWEIKAISGPTRTHNGFKVAWDPVFLPSPSQGTLNPGDREEINIAFKHKNKGTHKQSWVIVGTSEKFQFIATAH